MAWREPLPGALAAGTFDRRSPTLEQEVEDFLRQVKTAKQRNGTELVIQAVREEPPIYYVDVFPASGSATGSDKSGSDGFRGKASEYPALQPEPKDAPKPPADPTLADEAAALLRRFRGGLR